MQAHVQSSMRIEFDGTESVLSFDGSSFLRVGENISVCSGSCQSWDTTPFSTMSVQCDVSQDAWLEQQTQEVFASMEHLVLDALREVCFCGCHGVHGYDIDALQLKVEDVCLECDCFAQR